MIDITNLVNSIVKKLDQHNLKHEVAGDNHTFAIAPTCSIYTDNCTIEVYRNEITVNEVPVNNLDEMISAIIAAERIITK